MKDISIKNIPKETIYKDVVIIGNGPSGISLSYMLAGNWPHWNSEKVKKHPDELLRARLNYADSHKSLVMQDLKTLAEGLEGRSTNPVSLLLDSLEHPCADLGMELPSMLEYKSYDNSQIDHIVLGKGPPGGSWHRMDPNLRTLSLAAWMSLPGLSFSDWETLQLKSKIADYTETETELEKLNVNNGSCSKCIKLRCKQESIEYDNNLDIIENNNESESGALCCKCTKALKNDKISNIQMNLAEISKKHVDVFKFINKIDEPHKVPRRRNLSLKRQLSKEVQTRALVSRVAQYYKDYVHQMELEKYFLNDTIVTMIAPLHECCTLGKYRLARWVVYGINKSTGKAFYFACKNIVLANGVSDLANRLGLRGEDLNVAWVKHELPQLETALEAFDAKERSQLKPVLIVGAGLSAADAVTICRSSNIRVIHVFRSRTAGLDKMLPENVYPEYHEVHRMMKNQNNAYEYYTPLPEHTISDVTSETGGVHKVTVQNLNSSETKTFEVSFCAILIGSKPNLYFASSITKCPLKNRSANNCNLSDKFNNQQEHATPTLMNRRLSWFKNICAKCKNLNLCDWSRRNEYRKICGYNQINICDYNKICTDKDAMLCQRNESGIGLGIDPTKPVDCKSNQIAVNKYTNEIIREPKGLYAMGPLVGDNFVRFIPGGALAITAALHKEND